MKKPVIIFGVVLFFLIIVAAIFFRSNSNNNIVTPLPGANNDESLYSPISDASRKNFPAGDTLVLGTPSGSVTVKNFYKNVVQSIDEPHDLIIKDVAQFSIIYNAPTSNFDLFIKRKPVQESRAAAEKEFLSVLGIKEASACKLSAQITVPYNLDQELGGRHYPLSFCSSALP